MSTQHVQTRIHLYNFAISPIGEHQQGEIRKFAHQPNATFVEHHHPMPVSLLPGDARATFCMALNERGILGRYTCLIHLPPSPIHAAITTTLWLAQVGVLPNILRVDAAGAIQGIVSLNGLWQVNRPNLG